MHMDMYCGIYTQKNVYTYKVQCISSTCNDDDSKIVIENIGCVILHALQCQQLPEPSEEVMHESSESEPKRNETDKPK